MKSVRHFRRLVLLTLIATLLVPLSPQAQPADQRKQRNRLDLLEHVRSQASADTSVFRVDNGKAAVERAPRNVAEALVAAREAVGQDAPAIRLLGTAARLRAEAISGVPLPQPHTQGVTAGAGAAARQYTFREVTPAGDLDGDGTHDVITRDFVELRGDHYEVIENRIAGVRGSDGTVLWERQMEDPYTQFAVPLAVDVTGDGHADLLRQTLTSNSKLPSEPQTVGCGLIVPCVRSDDLEWLVEVLNGRDLSVAWSKRISGSLTYAGAGALVAGFEIQSSLAAAVEAEVAGDQNSDGVRDLILNVYDIDFDRVGVGVGYVGIVATDSIISLHADVLSGRNGAVIMSRTRNAKRGDAALRPAGNSTGDATPDLVFLDSLSTPVVDLCAFAVVTYACVSNRISTIAIEMIDGRTGATAWTSKIERVGDHGFALENAQSDLNGDGFDDVVIMSFGMFPFATALDMIDGKTGAWRWVRTHTQEVGIALQVVGPIGGAPGDDLAEAFIEFERNSDNFTFVTNRVEGATGALLNTTRHAVIQTDDSFSAGFVTLGNLDGDATQDIIITIATAESQNEESVYGSRVVVESGATSSTLTDRTEPGWGAWISGGDLNSDGLDDLILLINDYYEHQVIRLSAFFTQQNGRAWTREDGYPINIYGRYDLALVPDIDGGGGSDFVILRSVYNNSHLRRYDAVSGLTGGTLWGHGDAIARPTGGPSSISGTVRNEAGDPLAMVCVDVYEVDDYYIRDYLRTNADGVFTFERLGPGPYKVHFYPCGIEGYEAEWYNDKRSYASATEIPLDNGLNLVLDIVLSPPSIPINDDAIDTITIDSWPFWDRRDTSLATTEPGEPSCGGTKTIWYRMDGFPSATPLVFVRTNAQFPAGVAVFKGDDPFTGEMVACAASSTWFHREFGATYWIQVGTVDEDGGDVLVKITDNPIL